MSRKGTCSDVTHLATETVGKAGYKVIPVKVYFRSRGLDGSFNHTVAVLREGELLYKIADNYRVREGIVGPFKSIKEIAEDVAKSFGTSMMYYNLSVYPVR